MSIRNPLSNFYVKEYTFTDDTTQRLEDNPNIVLSSVNIHCYSNPAGYGNSLLVSGIIQPNAVVWFDSPTRPFDFMFKNYTPGSNTKIVIIGPLKD
jgi:hypothetical protein